jgi:two-component system, chemotaxis family, chemotaxis protein CheY
MTVLIVDDDCVMRSILRRILDSAGYQVLEASDGWEALKCMKQNHDITLVLVDWNMPNMNGYEFICAIRATSAYSHLYLIMVTVESEIECVTKALAAGANEYLMKPITRDTVLEKLQLLGITPN